ncbi:hypothetical protein CYY_001025 [Polysphondylium violaceum]|uniref:F-box domain-containing protein n=1 Tax=Polysphondylium violaceum TaxID=133409 RepID=A0A8J4V4Y6_9MYCE|nr:hypothetical protein CYY_001025 [Polysphondylium violaceum]
MTPIPIYVHTKILDYIYYSDHIYNRDKKVSIQYALVCKQWFQISKNLVNSYVIVDLDDLEKKHGETNNYRIITRESVENIKFDFFNIKNKLVKSLNSRFRSLKSITITNHDSCDYWMGDSLGLLNRLNKLKRKDKIQVNFDLEVHCFDPDDPDQVEEEDNEDEDEEEEEDKDKDKESEGPFEFNTVDFKFDFDFEYERSYGFCYEFIKLTNPKTLEFLANSSTDSGASHLRLYHSISKLNHRFSSVIINDDYIPLYALYRFLQSPHLQTFKVNLQFHFIAALYDSDSSDNNSYDFNRMDNFSFQDILPDDQFDSNRYLPNKVNEDNQMYCSFSRGEYTDSTVPIYSKQLWNQCLQLLSNNSTITELSIGNIECGYECLYRERHGDDNANVFGQQLYDDLLDALSNNKSIKSLCFDPIFSPDINSAFLTSLLERNKILEKIIIDGQRMKSVGPLIDQLSKLDTQCAIINKDDIY